MATTLISDLFQDLDMDGQLAFLATIAVGLIMMGGPAQKNAIVSFLRDAHNREPATEKAFDRLIRKIEQSMAKP